MAVMYVVVDSCPRPDRHRYWTYVRQRPFVVYGHHARRKDMARKVRDKDLDSRTARAKLKVSGKPYYRSLDEGLHIGYRKGKTSGKWVVRYYLDDGKYAVETLDVVADDK